MELTISVKGASYRAIPDGDPGTKEKMEAINVFFVDTGKLVRYIVYKVQSGIAYVGLTYCGKVGGNLNSTMGHTAGRPRRVEEDDTHDGNHRGCWMYGILHCEFFSGLASI